MKYDVFVSYSRKDSEIVQSVVDRLKAEGYRCWMDVTGIESSDEFKRVLVTAIRQSKVILFFSSANSNSTEWTVKEINIAVQMKKPIIPVRLDDAPYDDSILFDLSGLDYIAYEEKSIHDVGLEKLLRGVAVKCRAVQSQLLNGLKKPASDGDGMGNELLPREKVPQTGSMVTSQSRCGNATKNTDCLLGGRYRIIRQCGMGDMGTVLLAEDMLLGKRKVAVKIVPEELVANERAFTRFKEHVKVIMINHPNIATCRSVEVDDDGTVFLVIDYVDGITLKDYIRIKGRCLTEYEVLELFTPIADAIDFMHMQGVLHGDIKPQTVLIAEDDRPYVIDLGLSRIMREMMTQVKGTVFNLEGTLSYQSPECLQGRGRLSEKSDVYSFSLLVYECLTGENFTKSQAFMCGHSPGRKAIGSNLRNSRMLPSLLKGLSMNPQLRPASCRDVLGLETKFRSRIGSWLARVFSGSPAMLF